MNSKKKTDRTKEIDLLELAKFLWQHAAAVIAVTLVFGIAAFLITVVLIKPTYESHVQLYVNNTSDSQNTGYISTTEINAAISLVDTYSVILKSDTTLNQIASRLDQPYTAKQLSGMISVSAVNDTQIFRVTVTSTSPEKAQQIANAIAQVLPQRIGEIVDGSSVRIVDEAELPTQKAGPSLKKNTAIGLLLGFVLAAAVFTVRFLTDDVLHDADAIRDLYDLPVLGVIPDAYGENTQKYKKYYGSKYYGKGYDSYSYQAASMKGAKK